VVFPDSLKMQGERCQTAISKERSELQGEKQFEVTVKEVG
jgi:hypothetical protein